MAALVAHNGIRYASPAMMALSNLLSHPAIGEKRVSEPLERRGRKVLRAAKDLGRVLALARLSTREETEHWALQWASALRQRFPSEAVALAARAGDGLKALVENPSALEEAVYAVGVGLLAGKGVDAPQMRALAEQLKVDALEKLAEAFKPAASPWSA